MEGKDEDIILGANNYREKQLIGICAQTQESGKDQKEPHYKKIDFQ